MLRLSGGYRDGVAGRARDGLLDRGGQLMLVVAGNGFRDLAEGALVAVSAGRTAGIASTEVPAVGVGAPCVGTAVLGIPAGGIVPTGTVPAGVRVAVAGSVLEAVVLAGATTFSVVAPVVARAVAAAVRVAAPGGGELSPVALAVGISRTPPATEVALAPVVPAAVVTVPVVPSTGVAPERSLTSIVAVPEITVPEPTPVGVTSVRVTSVGVTAEAVLGAVVAAAVAASVDVLARAPASTKSVSVAVLASVDVAPRSTGTVAVLAAVDTVPVPTIAGTPAVSEVASASVGIAA